LFASIDSRSSYLEAVILLRDEELSPDVPLGEEVVDGEPSDPGGKALVEPEVGPPLHRHEVAKPLMSELVADNVGDVLLGLERRLALIVQEVDGAIRDKTPLFFFSWFTVKRRRGKW